VEASLGSKRSIHPRVASALLGGIGEGYQADYYAAFEITEAPSRDGGKTRRFQRDPATTKFVRPGGDLDFVRTRVLDSGRIDAATTLLWSPADVDPTTAYERTEVLPAASEPRSRRWVIGLACLLLAFAVGAGVPFLML
jgi:hypothetical protein